MKTRISTNRFENMIAECVRQVLSESCQPKRRNQRIKMNDSQMQNYVRNIINEELENEGFMKNLWGGVKNAFGGDASRVAANAQSAGSAALNGIQNIGQSAWNGMKAVGNGIAQGARQVAGTVQQGAQDFGRGTAQRYRAAKAGYEASRDNNKIQSVINDLQKLQQQGVLHGNATNAVIQELIGKMKMLQGGNNAAAASYRNSIGQNYAPQQQQNTAM
jgi:hypothetical protein